MKIIGSSHVCSWTTHENQLEEMLMNKILVYKSLVIYVSDQDSASKPSCWTKHPLIISCTRDSRISPGAQAPWSAKEGQDLKMVAHQVVHWHASLVHPTNLRVWIPLWLLCFWRIFSWGSPTCWPVPIVFARNYHLDFRLQTTYWQMRFPDWESYRKLRLSKEKDSISKTVRTDDRESQRSRRCKKS